MKKRISAKLGSEGRMITASKGRYRHNNPSHVTVFNSTVLNETGDLVWRGDLDLTLDREGLVELAKEVEGAVYVFYEASAGESDAYVLAVHPDGTTDIGPKLTSGVYKDGNGEVRFKVEPKEDKEYESFMPLELDRSEVIAEACLKDFWKNFEDNLDNSTDDLETSPLSLLHTLVMVIPGVKEVSQIMVSPAVDKRLHDATIRYFRMHAEELGLWDDYSFDRNTEFYWFDQSPVAITGDWVRDDKVYIRKTNR